MDDRLTHIFKGAAAGFGAIAGYLLGGFSVFVHLLLIMVIVDWLTGWAAAWIRGSCAAELGFMGLFARWQSFWL